MRSKKIIPREIIAELVASAKEYPVVTLFGPRQSGKTTLVQDVFHGKPYRSLEDPDVRRMAEIDPRGFLGELGDGAILDEIQRCPQLLSYIQGIVDSKGTAGRFVLTGSHQPDLHQAVSQTLTGRTAVLTLLPFSINELKHYRKRWKPFDLVVQGTFPRVHDQGLKVDRFYNSYVQTYVERDVRAIINLKELRRFETFLSLIAGRVGQIVNYVSLSNDVGVSSTTIKNWISVLKASYIVFELQPYAENVSKRVVKSPKLYFTDTGLICHLLGIHTPEQAERDPLRGGLYENLIILEIYKKRLNLGLRPELFFYRDTHGNEVDLLIRSGRNLMPIEIKSSVTFNEEYLKGIANLRKTVGPRLLPGYVLYNGEKQYRVNEITVANPMIHSVVEKAGEGI
jgi:predicted AAA+ superfamily ATPase